MSPFLFPTPSSLISHPTEQSFGTILQSKKSGVAGPEHGSK